MISRLLCFVLISGALFACNNDPAPQRSFNKQMLFGKWQWVESNQLRCIRYEEEIQFNDSLITTFWTCNDSTFTEPPLESEYTFDGKRTVIYRGYNLLTMVIHELDSVGMVVSHGKATSTYKKVQ